MCLAQILRVMDSLQLTAKYSVATPVNWKHGDRVMIVPTLSDEQAHDKVHPTSYRSFAVQCISHRLGFLIAKVAPLIPSV